MNNVIQILTPNLNDINYGKTIQLSYVITDLDVNFKSVVFLLNDEIVKTENLTKSVFNISPINGINFITAYCLNKNDKKIIDTEIQVLFTCVTENITKDTTVYDLIQYQLPEYIRSDYPNFIDFIGAYYEFLEKSNDPNKVIYNLENYRNIDDIPDFVLNKIKQEVMKDFNVELTIDRETGDPINTRNVVKNIKEFYDSKGTENSIRFLFRILYDKEIDIYYPKTDIFKPSANVYSRKNILNCYLTESSDIDAIKNGIIYQENDDAEYTVTARVADITKTLLQGNYYGEIVLKELSGSFDSSKQTKVKTIIDGAEETLILNVIYSTESTGIYGSTRLSEWLRDTRSGKDNIDVLLAGDSNTGHAVYGWNGGLMSGMIENGIKMYGTPIFSAYQTGGLVPAGYKCFAYLHSDQYNQSYYNSDNKVLPGSLYGRSELTKHFSTGIGVTIPTGVGTFDQQTTDPYINYSKGLKPNTYSLDYLWCDKEMAGWNFGISLRGITNFDVGGSLYNEGYISPNHKECPLLLEPKLRYRFLGGKFIPTGSDTIPQFKINIIGSDGTGEVIDGGSVKSLFDSSRQYQYDPPKSITVYNDYWIPHEYEFANQNAYVGSYPPASRNGVGSYWWTGNFIWGSDVNGVPQPGGTYYDSRMRKNFSAALQSIYAPIKGVSVSNVEYYPGGTMIQIGYDIINTPHETWALIIQEHVERQKAAGGTGRICFWLQGGLNDANVWRNYPTLYPDNKPEKYKQQILKIIEKIKNVWQKIGYDKSNLCFAIMCSHEPNYDLNLEEYRDILKEINEPDITIIDIPEIINKSEYSQYYRDNGAHFVPIGYNTIAKKIFEKLLNYTSSSTDENLTETSFVSKNKVLQDSDYYQDFSYDILSDVNSNEHLPIVKKIVHPAGFKVFGSFQGKTNLDLQITTTIEQLEETRQLSAVIGNYIPYVLSTKIDLYEVPIIIDFDEASNPIIGYISPYENGYRWGSGGTVKPTSSVDLQIIHIMETNEADSIPEALPEAPLGTKTEIESNLVVINTEANVFLPANKLPNTGQFWVVGKHWNQTIQENANTNDDLKTFLEFTIGDITNIQINDNTG